MSCTENFEREASALDSATFDHIGDTAGDEVLERLDGLYGRADALSLANADLHRRILWVLAAAASLLTLFFLLYDEAELHGLILACGVMIVALFVVFRVAHRLECHAKYLEYRVLAEGARVAFFLRRAGVEEKACELMPWAVRHGLPEVTGLLADAERSDRPMEPHSVLDSWIRDQRSYHERALARTRAKEKAQARIGNAALALSVFIYLLALAFELGLGAGVLPDTMDPGVTRAILKIILGTVSVLTLFVGSTLGKMSLSNEADDHERMATLFADAESHIEREGESAELIVSLAREALVENSRWYAYQSTNAPDISL